MQLGSQKLFSINFKVWGLIALFLIIISILFLFSKQVNTIASFSSSKPNENNFADGTIDLRNNNTFHYKYFSDLDQYDFYGEWIAINDTLILTSKNKESIFIKTYLKINLDSSLSLLNSLHNVSTPGVGYKTYYKMKNRDGR